MMATIQRYNVSDTIAVNSKRRSHRVGSFRGPLRELTGEVLTPLTPLTHVVSGVVVDCYAALGMIL